MAGTPSYLSILTLNVNRLNFPIKRHCLANWIKKEDLKIYCLQETHFTVRNKDWLGLKDGRRFTKLMVLRAGRSTYIRQSRPIHISQTRQRRSLHTNNRSNTSKGNNSYQFICTQCQCTQLH
jgi:exonuclease III